MSRKTTVFENGMIWFGAAVGLAEILSGTYLAPLGFSKGLLSIIIGHLIGCVLLFLAGYIGGKTRSSAMETVTFLFPLTLRTHYFPAKMNSASEPGTIWTGVFPGENRV